MTMSSVNDRISDVSTAISAIFEDLSGEKPAASDAQTTFLEMGYDSLFLTQVAQKIQSQMKVKVTFRQLLGEFATIPALAKFLADKMPAPQPAAWPAQRRHRARPRRSVPRRRSPGVRPASKDCSATSCRPCRS